MIGSSYKISEKKLLDIRSKIFLKKGVSVLLENGFESSPFSTDWFGRNNLGDYTYTLCRLSNDSYLERITTEISRGDRWIKVFLNIFKLNPIPEQLEQLKGLDGLKFCIPPNSISNMRLKVDSIEGIPLFNYDFMFGGYKLKSFNSENGLKRRAEQLGDLIEKDLSNIDDFVKRWHELHKPNITDWNGALSSA